MSTGPDAVGAVRRAVRDALAGLPAPLREVPLLVAWSGGADSTALLAAARHLAPGRVHVAVVDHDLQDGSAERAAALVASVDLPAAVHRVTVDGPGGLEAAARSARYAALRAARPHPDAPVLLGHTLDDQAETVLLGLGRGSGPRSLAGMATWDEPWLRPLLAVRRDTTRAACAAQGLPVWDDPHNAEPRFTRVRLRTEVLPLLEDVLAGGVAEALARTAAQLRDDGAALDAAALELLERATRAAEVPDSREVHDPREIRDPRTDPCRLAGEPGVGEPGVGEPGVGEPGVGEPGVGEPGVGQLNAELDAGVLAGAPAALRRRALRAWLLAAGAAGLTDGHLRAADDLVGRWRGQGAVALPQRLELIRERGRLRVRTAAWPGAR